MVNYFIYQININNLDTILCNNRINDILFYFFFSGKISQSILSTLYMSYHCSIDEIRLYYLSKSNFQYTIKNIYQI